MNEIRVKRMLLAALAMLVVWIFVEIMVEHVIARWLLGQTPQEMWLETTDGSDWGPSIYLVAILLAILDCALLIWLYASLRPMYGVGTRTALIASAFGIILVFSISIDAIILGWIPLRVGLMEAVFEAIEFPIAMIVGAGVYEGPPLSGEQDRD